MNRSDALDPGRFDQIVRGARPEQLWDLPAIAGALGVSVNTARRWANDPARGLPISRPGGRYFALRSELQGWLVAQ